jgi:cytochrome b6-f complex iron-sulfur subunit
VTETSRDAVARIAHDQLSRRAVLGAGAAGSGAVLLAACGGGSSDSGKSNAGSGGKVKSGVGLAKLADIPVGEAVSAEDGGKPIVVAQPTKGTAAAFSAICTHMGCTVKPAGKELHCPCHGSKYDASTGKVLHGPAPKPLPKVPVHVANGEVVSGA